MLLLSLVLTTPAQDRDLIDAAIARYRERTRVVIPCSAPRDDEIIVCARREADEYRAPLVSAGNARNSVPLRTQALLEDHGLMPCGQGAFLARCGMVGVTMRVGFDGSFGLVERELAP